MTQRFGFNTNGNALDNKQLFYDVFRRTRPVVSTVMDNYDVAMALVAESIPGQIVVYRKWDAREGQQWNDAYVSPRSYASTLTNNFTSDRRLYYYVLNEPNPGRDPGRIAAYTRWVSDVARILEDAGFHACLGNIGPGTWHEDDITAGHWDDYIFLLSEWCGDEGPHIAGFHEYTSILAPYGVGLWPEGDLFVPERMQPENWPDPEVLTVEYWGDDTKKYLPPYWFLLRSSWFLIRADEIGLPRWNIALTECFHDGMPGMGNTLRQLQNIFGNSGYDTIRCPSTLRDIWHAYWPQWTFDEALFEQFKWLDQIYPSNYLGFTMFSWTNDPGWSGEFGCSYQEYHQLHQLLEAYNEEEPVEYKLFPGWIKSTGNYSVNIREAATTSARIVGVVNEPERASLAPGSAVSGEGYQWVYIEKGGQYGWVVFSLVEWEQDVPQEPPVEGMPNWFVSFLQALVEWLKSLLTGR